MTHSHCRGKSCWSSSGFDRREGRAWQLPGPRASLPSSQRAAWLGGQNQELGDSPAAWQHIWHCSSLCWHIWQCSRLCWHIWQCPALAVLRHRPPPAPQCPAPNPAPLLAWRTAQKDNLSCALQALPLLCPTPPSAKPWDRGDFLQEGFSTAAFRVGQTKAHRKWLVQRTGSADRPE